MNPFLHKEEEKEEKDPMLDLLAKVGKRDDRSKLPPELLAQFRSKLNDDHQSIIDIIENRGGIADLDELQIDLYEQSVEEDGEDNATVTDRAKIQKDVNKLLKDGRIHRVIGRKGIYSLTPLSVKKEQTED